MRFDTPTTRALSDFIRREGPDGLGRVVGLSIEDDGVFIYTRSAAWCDDAGAGTFRADSETGAIRVFRERVRPGNGCPVNPEPADMTVPAGPCGCADCMAGRHAEPATRAAFKKALATSESYTVIYRNAAPAEAAPVAVATLSRPRLHGDATGLFTLTDTTGRLVKTWTRSPTRSDVQNALATVADIPAEVREIYAEYTAAELAEAVDGFNASAETARARASHYAKGAPGLALVMNLRANAQRRAEVVAEMAAEAAEREATPDSAELTEGPAETLDSLAEHAAELTAAENDKAERWIAREDADTARRAANVAADAGNAAEAVELYLTAAGRYDAARMPSRARDCRAEADDIAANGCGPDDGPDGPHGGGKAPAKADKGAGEAKGHKAPDTAPDTRTAGELAALAVRASTPALESAVRSIVRRLTAAEGGERAALYTRLQAACHVLASRQSAGLMGAPVNASADFIAKAEARRAELADAFALRVRPAEHVAPMSAEAESLALALARPAAETLADVAEELAEADETAARDCVAFKVDSRWHFTAAATPRDVSAALSRAA